MTFKGIDLTQIVLALVAVIGFLLQRAQAKLADASTQDAAYKRLAVIGLSMVADLWGALTEAYRQDMLDGTLDRELYKKIIEEKIEKYTSRAELEKLATAAKLPVPGIIAWLAEFAIDRIMSAHDPDNIGVPQVYPVNAPVYTDAG